MMARTVNCAGSCALMGNPPSVSRPCLRPAALAAAVLFVEPLHQRLEILDDRGRDHLARAGELLERVLPGLAAAERKHFLEGAPRVPVAVDRAFVQPPAAARLLAERAVE